MFAKIYGYFRILMINSTHWLDVGDLKQDDLNCILTILRHSSENRLYKCSLNGSTQANSCRAACHRDDGVLPDVNALLSLRKNEHMQLFSDVMAEANVTVRKNDFIENSDCHGGACYGTCYNGSNALSMLHQCVLTSAVYNFEFELFHCLIFLTFFGKHESMA